MHKAKRHYSTKLTSYAKSLRQKQTPAEEKLWVALRENTKNTCFKFRRQQPIGKYIADFYCASAKCVVEVDGMSHAQKAIADKARDDFMLAKGIKVLRFTEGEILRDVDSIVCTIYESL